MRAAVLHGRADLRVETVPEPVLQAGEIRILVRAALTCGTDLKVYRRGYHARMIRPPSVFGHELAGEILEVGKEVTEWKVGDRVVAGNSAPCGACFYCSHQRENLCDNLLFLNGAYAQTAVIPGRIVQRNLLRLEGGTNWEDAALTEPLACVVQGMEDAELRAGQRVLVIGSGPIGLMFVALAKGLGCEVAVAGRGQARLDRASRLGAKWVASVVSDQQMQCDMERALGRNFDVVVEAVGKPVAWEAAVALVRKGGRVNFFGGCPAGAFAALDTERMHYSSLQLLSSFHHRPATIRRALQFIENGTIRADDFVDGECRLTDLPALFRSMEQGNHAVKTSVKVDE